MHPTGPKNFSEALASPAYMVATPMITNSPCLTQVIGTYAW